MLSVVAGALCSCSSNSPELTQQQKMDNYEHNEFKPRIDKVLNSSLPEAERKRAEYDIEREEMANGE